MSDHWLSQRPARLFFRFAAVMTSGLVLLLWVAGVATLFVGEQTVQAYAQTSPIQILGLFLGVVGSTVRSLSTDRHAMVRGGDQS
ncbi:MAG TPA: hypothetical protein VIW23_08770 [Candidatus Acidoferrum sp.]